MADSANLWDQQPGESDEAYARFLRYRNLGFKRSFRRAYRRYLQELDGYTGGLKGLHVPGQWTEDAHLFSWTERAAAWDVRNLTVHGARVASLHVGCLTRIALKNARAARRLSPGDDGWADLLDSVRLVSEFLTPDVVRAIQDHHKPARPAVRARPDDRRRVE